MTDTHKFMLLTGKYYNDEDICILSDLYYFSRYDSNGNYVYSENSTGYWENESIITETVCTMKTQLVTGKN